MQAPIPLDAVENIWNKLRILWHKSKHTAPNGTCQPTAIGHTLITSGLLALNFTLFVSLTLFAAGKSKEWLEASQPSPMPQQTMVQDAMLKARFAAQIQEIQTQRQRHAEVMSYFYIQYFVSLSMASGSALAAILLAFFISRDGWERANNGLINAFFVTFSAATLYTQIPNLFQQKDNLERNRELYISYDVLGNEISSYLVTGSTISDETQQVVKIEAAEFIHQVDQQLAELNQIPIDFDATQTIKPPELPQVDLPAGLPTPPPKPLGLP